VVGCAADIKAKPDSGRKGQRRQDWFYWEEKLRKTKSRDQDGSDEHINLGLVSMERGFPPMLRTSSWQSSSRAPPHWSSSRSNGNRAPCKQSRVAELAREGDFQSLSGLTNIWEATPPFFCPTCEDFRCFTFERKGEWAMKVGIWQKRGDVQVEYREAGYRHVWKRKVGWKKS